MQTINASADDGFSEAMALMVDRHRAGDLAGADAAIQVALAVRPGHPGARQAGGLIAAEVGSYRRSVDLLEDFARLPTAAPEILVATATVHFALGNNVVAAQFSRRVLAARPGDLASRLQLAKCLQASGALEEAVGHLRAVLVCVPSAPDGLLTYGALVTRHRREPDRRVLDWWCMACPLEEAAWSLSALLPSRPGRGPAHLRRSLVLMAGDARSAQAQIHVASTIHSQTDLAVLYRRLVIRFPGDAEAWHIASRYADGASDLDRSILAAKRASLLEPGLLHYDLQVARACRRDKRNDTAKTLFSRITRVAATSRSASGFTGTKARLQLARIAEEEHDYRAAFEHATEGNQLARLQEPLADAWIAQRLETVKAATLSTPALRDHLGNARNSAGDAPVFLIGFPRSGTTLLEQVLDGHPAIATIEEQPTLVPVIQSAHERYGSIRAFVEQATPSDLRQAAQAYLTARASFLPTGEAGLLVDKMPLSTVLVPLILRIFPRARFLFALRHPCDVCLSCFFSDFVLNANMAPFTDFNDTAVFYDRVMGLWQRCEAELPIDYHAVRYESVVENLEAEARAAIGYLGLPWVPDIVDFHHTAREKSRQGRIRTPSYAQVTEPLYSRAAGRWRHYRDRFDAVRPLLEPHVEAYGYKWDDGAS